ncbi:hypothetical protein D3C80_1378930 [compost metagenome]
MGDLGIDVRQGTDQSYGLRELSAHLQIETLAAGLAHCPVGIGGRIEGQDVFFFDVEGGEGAAQAVLEQLTLEADLVADAFLRSKGLACGVQAVIRLERGRGVGEQAVLWRQLIEQAGALGQGVVVLPATVAEYLIVDGLLEMFQAHPQNAAQAFAEYDLVLKVEGPALDLLEEVRTRAFAVWFWLTINRVVDIDRIGAASEGGHSFVLAQVLVFAADQQFVLPTADVEQTPQFELGDAVVPPGIALTVAAVDGVQVGVQGACFRGMSPELAILVVAGQA